MTGSPHDSTDAHADDHDRGLALDLGNFARTAARRRMTRRAALGVLGAGAVGAATVAALPGGADAEPEVAAPSARTSKTPEETNGPYPADGSNGPDVLDESGVVRRDIRSNFGSATGSAATGVALTVALTVVHAATSKPCEDAAVYLWHCDRLGRYSMYSTGVEDRNYLRGVQVAGPKGRLHFTTIYPACYAGRWPHIHYEVYPSKHAATRASGRLLTSQIALPRRTSHAVYATGKYPGSAHNLSQVSLRTDTVFSDGWSREMATMSGSVANGYTATLRVAI